MTVRRTTLLALLVVVAVGTAACGGDDDGTSPAPGDSAGGSSEAAVVTVKTFDFQPDRIEVEAGETVSFVNKDSTTHTATAGTREEPDPGTFDIELKEGDGGEVTLDEPGTYDFFCTIHEGPGMTAQIVVR